MTWQRTRYLAIAWLAILLVVVAIGCGKNPAAPTYDNPFDPSGTAGDPFELHAAFAGTTVTLTWHQPQGYGIVYYKVFRSTDASTYARIANVNATAQATISHSDTHPVATTTNYYKVQAVASDSTLNFLSDVAAADVDVPPVITIGTGAAQVSTRHQSLRVRAAGYDSVRIARRSGFPADSTVTLAIPDSVVSIADWDLGPATANGDTLRVYAYAFSLIDVGSGPVLLTSDTAIARVRVNFAPTVRLPGAATTVADLPVQLVVSNEAAGITRMRFAPTRAALADSAWLPAAPTHDYRLIDTTADQRVYAQYESEFGPSVVRVDSITVAPDPLTAASFTLDVPSNHVVDTPELTIFNDAVATQMRFSTRAGFQGASWLAYQDTTTITFEDTTGFQIIYAQFRNHWAESPVLTDQVIFSPVDIAIDFQTPLDGDVVQGGTLTALRGRTWTSNANAPVDTVKVDVGDGEWVTVDGTSTWSYDWNVPLLTADTPRVLSAIAIVPHSDGPPDTARTAIQVTISQLAVTFTAPAAMDTLAAGTLVSIIGTATPFLAGAALDSVVVLAGSDRITASGLESWTAEWDTPTVSADSTVTLIARVYAGTDTSERSRDYVLSPGR